MPTSTSSSYSSASSSSSPSSSYSYSSSSSSSSYSSSSTSSTTTSPSSSPPSSSSTYYCCLAKSAASNGIFPTPFCATTCPEATRFPKEGASWSTMSDCTSGTNKCTDSRVASCLPVTKTKPGVSFVPGAKIFGTNSSAITAAKQSATAALQAACAASANPAGLVCGTGCTADAPPNPTKVLGGITLKKLEVGNTATQYAAKGDCTFTLTCHF